MLMKKIFTLIAVVAMAIGVQAQTTEKALFEEGGAYGNGATLTTENCKVVLGNDRTTKNYDVKLASVKAYCAELFGQQVMVENSETGAMEEKTRVIYVVGNQNPKDGELDGDSSTGSGYKPASGNLPQSGTYYMITPQQDGHITAFIVLNSGKSLYVAKASTGECLPQDQLVVKADGDEPAVVELDENFQTGEKITGTVEFDVVAGETYYLFCAGSKLSFGGYIYTFAGGTPFSINPDNLMPLFTYCWNEAESLSHNDDGTITYNAVAWGGLAAWLAVDGPVDLSKYGKLVFEFAEPTTVNTQILAGSATAWGEPGIKKLVCSFDGKDVSAIEQIALQASDVTTIVVTRIYLEEKGDPIPEGDHISIIDKFNGCWNEAETLVHNEDGSITFNAVSWGGASAWLAENDIPVDWSMYTKLVFEYAEPSAVNTQGFIQTTTENITFPGNAGITKLECPFEDRDVSKVNQVALQCAEPTTLVITAIYLVANAEGIGEVRHYIFDADAPMYNLSGVRVNKDYKGVVIQNGHKFIRK